LTSQRTYLHGDILDICASAAIATDAMGEASGKTGAILLSEATKTIVVLPWRRQARI
jgi:uncharacterized protein